MKKQTLLSVLLLSFIINHAQTFTAPYSEGFDTVTVPNLPQYWSSITTANSSNIYSRNDISNSLPNSINLQSGNNHTGNVILVSPRFTDIDQFKQIRFNIKKNTNGANGFTIGTLTDPNDATTFHEIQNFDIGYLTYNWEETTVTFENYNGIDEFIAIKHNSDSLLFNIVIDDFIYENKALSINDNALFSYIKIFPIPTSNILNIKTNSNIKSINIFTMLGENIISKKYNNNLDISLNIAHLTIGKYLIKISFKNKIKYKYFIKSF